MRKQPRNQDGEFKPLGTAQKAVDAMSSKAADGAKACLECGKAMNERHDPNCNTGRRLAMLAQQRAQSRAEAKAKDRTE